MRRSGDSDSVEEASELERTIGLAGALTIGIGTMVGAGIFVFPGLAAERAGPAATVSFAIGAGVALLVALLTAELATAMPESGGGYYFISRGLGGFFGGVVGIGLTFGLVFAAAFYLVGFGEYAVAIFAELGIQWTVPTAVELLSIASVLGIVAGGVLTATGIFGTENVEALQNALVGLLLAILVVFLVRSGLDVFGLLGDPRVPQELVPYGYGTVLTTAALVFTSYLGFAQIATVAGEIVEPSRNLPLALFGSVLVVGVLYVVTVFVAASTLEPNALAELAPAIGRTVAALVEPSDVTITLLYVSGEDEEIGQRTLSEVAGILEDAGVSEHRISRSVEQTDNPERILADELKDHDPLVIGEDALGILGGMFDQTSEKMAEQILVPVLVVRTSLEE